MSAMRLIVSPFRLKYAARQSMMPNVNAHTGGLACWYMAMAKMAVKTTPCISHQADIALSFFDVVFIISVFYVLRIRQIVFYRQFAAGHLPLIHLAFLSSLSVAELP